MTDLAALQELKAIRSLMEQIAETSKEQLIATREQTNVFNTLIEVLAENEELMDEDDQLRPTYLNGQPIA